MYDGLEFRHLRCFVAVAEECNFGRAALRLHLAQPSLSAQIKKLEDGIHATLFLRGRSGASLTPAGRFFLPEAKRLLHMSKLAFQTTSSVHSGIDLPLRFGYSPFVNHHLVQEAVSGYRDIVPGGQIESSSECSAPLVNKVAEGLLDAALVLKPIGEHKLLVHRICTEKVLVCLRRDDPLAGHESIPKDLIADRLRILVARIHNPLFYDELMRKFAKAKIRLKPTDFVSAPAEMQFLVKIGPGFGLIRETEPLDPDLTRRSISGLSLHVKTAFICHPDQQRPALPLLAFRIAKMCAVEAEMNGKKRPNGSVGVELPAQLPIFADRSSIS
jgi:DNA-binding transcriptional LysR family regulator